METLGVVQVYSEEIVNSTWKRRLNARRTSKNGQKLIDQIVKAIRSDLKRSRGMQKKLKSVYMIQNRRELKSQFTTLKDRLRVDKN